MMKVHRCAIAGVMLIEPRVFRDERGFFFESFRQTRYSRYGLTSPFVQDNRSSSLRNVLRGLHYQIRHCQGHLVTITRGAVFDVGVDLRRGSPTFGHWAGFVLTASPPLQLYLPPGLAHGFCVLSDIAEIWYKCTEIYHPEDEGGLLWCDPDVGIEWPITDPIIAPRDAAYPRLKDIPEHRLPMA